MKFEMNQRAAGAGLVLAIACGTAVATGPNQ